MEYFAGLDVSMEETQVCVTTQNGAVIHEAKVPSAAASIAAALARVPACRRVLFETGRMAPMLYHGLSRLGLPVVCVESRQAYQALKSLATHKTDRNDARGLAHLARTGFFKPVHVKSLRPIFYPCVRYDLSPMSRAAQKTYAISGENQRFRIRAMSANGTADKKRGAEAPLTGDADIVRIDDSPMAVVRQRCQERSRQLCRRGPNCARA
jgi:transposase